MKIKNVFLILIAVFGGILPFSAKGEVDSLGKTPYYWYKFDGNMNSSGQVALEWAGTEQDATDKDGKSTYEACSQDDSLYPVTDQAARIHHYVDNSWIGNNTKRSHPYTPLEGKGLDLANRNWTIITRCKIANIPEGIIWSLGQATEGKKMLAFLTKGNNMLALSRRSNKDITIEQLASATVRTADKQFHTYAFVYNNSASTLICYVDGEPRLLHENVDFTDQDWHFQIGSAFAGVELSWTKMSLGTLISDWRVYREALSQEDLKLLSQPTPDANGKESNLMAPYPTDASLGYYKAYAEVTEETKYWTDLQWYQDENFEVPFEEGFRTDEKTEVELCLSENSSLVMNGNKETLDGEANYLNIAISRKKVESNVKAPVLTFLMPNKLSLQEVLPQKQNEWRVYTVLKSAPANVGGAQYDLGIEGVDYQNIEDFANNNTFRRTETQILMISGGQQPKNMISLKVGGQDPINVDTDYAMGPYPRSAKFWNYSAQTSRGTETMERLRDGLYDHTTMTAYIYTYGNAKDSSAPTDSVNGKLTKKYLYGLTTGFPKAEQDDGHISAAPNKRGWQVHLKDIPYRAYDLYLVFAGPGATCNAAPYAIKVGGGSWQFYKGNGSGTEKTTNGSAKNVVTWSASSYSTDGSLQEGKNYLKIRVTPAEFGAVRDLEITHGYVADYITSKKCEAGLAAIQIVEIPPQELTWGGEGPDKKWNTDEAWLEGTSKATFAPGAYVTLSSRLCKSTSTMLAT